MGANDYNAEAYVDPIDLALTRLQVQLAKPVWGVRPLASDFTQGMTREGVARLHHQFHYQLSVAEGRPDRGALEARGGDYVIGPKVSLQMKRYGDSVNMKKAAILSLDGGWGRIAPQIERAIQKEPMKVYARMLNYGHLIKDWTGSFFFAASKYANPKKKKYGTYGNIITGAGSDPLADRVDAMLQVANEVLGVDGDPLGLEDAKKYLWLPTTKYRTGMKILDVQNLVVDEKSAGVFGGGNTSKIYKDALPVHVPWLRSDMICLASTVPDEEMSQFTKIRGVRAGEGTLEENENPEDVGAGVPEFEVRIQDKTSDLYAEEGLIAYHKRHWRGYGLGWGGGVIASFDGLPTDADPEKPTIDYTTLPKRFY
jgi:hypothetical protein